MSMALPTLKEYLDTLNDPRFLSDPDLREGQPIKSSRGTPLFTPGRNALTVKYRGKDGLFWAVRCFTGRIVPEATYHSISQFISSTPVQAFLYTDYQPAGVRVNNTDYPICKMEWVEGLTLDKYIEKNGSDAHRMGKLAHQFYLLAEDLTSQGCAHGDLQHGNIMVTDQDTVKLVDYDGMYIPAFRGKHIFVFENGHLNYQHPQRTLNDFSPTMDRFSTIVIYLALKVLEKQPKRFDKNQEAILFRKEDFDRPDQSARIALLEQIGFPDAARAFREVCTGNLSDIPTLYAFIWKDNALLQELEDSNARFGQQLEGVKISRAVSSAAPNITPAASPDVLPFEPLTTPYPPPTSTPRPATTTQTVRPYATPAPTRPFQPLSQAGITSTPSTPVSTPSTPVPTPRPTVVKPLAPTPTPAPARLSILADRQRWTVAENIYRRYRGQWIGAYRRTLVYAGILGAIPAGVLYGYFQNTSLWSGTFSLIPHIELLIWWVVIGAITAVGTIIALPSKVSISERVMRFLGSTTITAMLLIIVMVLTINLHFVGVIRNSGQITLVNNLYGYAILILLMAVALTFATQRFWRHRIAFPALPDRSKLMDDHIERFGTWNKRRYWFGVVATLGLADFVGLAAYRIFNLRFNVLDISRRLDILINNLSLPISFHMGVLAAALVIAAIFYLPPRRRAYPLSHVARVGIILLLMVGVGVGVALLTHQYSIDLSPQLLMCGAGAAILLIPVQRLLS